MDRQTNKADIEEDPDPKENERREHSAFPIKQLEYAQKIE
jgi:hypothetical protein